MRIKRMLVMIGLVSFAGASSYAMAQSYAYRSPAYGVKASGVINDIVNENESEPETPPVISNITTPSSFLFSENNDELSGNVGDVGTVTIYDEIGGAILGQTVSLENGNFSSSLSPTPLGRDVLYVEVTDNIETLGTNITVPDLAGLEGCDLDNDRVYQILSSNNIPGKGQSLAQFAWSVDLPRSDPMEIINSNNEEIQLASDNLNYKKGSLISEEPGPYSYYSTSTETSYRSIPTATYQLYVCD